MPQLTKMAKSLEALEQLREQIMFHHKEDFDNGEKKKKKATARKTVITEMLILMLSLLGAAH